jgi:hypothetical protein
MSSLYSKKISSKRMGLGFNTRIFQMNHKKTPNDSHGIIQKNGKLKYMSIANWIDLDPIRLWNEIYCSTPRLSLCSNSFNLLLNKISEISPETYKQYLEKRSSRSKFKPF